MSPEREKTPERKDKKKRLNFLTAIFEEILQRIRELQEIIDERKREHKPVKQEEAELRQLEGERDRRREEYNRLPYAQTVEQERSRSAERITLVLEQVKQAPPADKKVRLAELVKVIGEEEAKAETLLSGEAAGIKDPKLRGIARSILESEIKKAQAEQARLLVATGQPQQDEEYADMVKRAAEMGVPEEKRKNLATSAINFGRGRSFESYFGELEIKLEDFLDPNPDNPEAQKARDIAFDDIFSVVDSAPGEFFREGIDYETMAKLGEFMRRLSQIPGVKGTEILNDYIMRRKTKQTIHDAAAALEQGAAGPEDYSHMVERFGPEILDQIFKEEGADIAAHLYEVGTEFLRVRQNGEIPPHELMINNPKAAAGKGECFLDNWVRKRFEELIKVKHGLSDDDFNKQWPEQRLRRVLSAGRGFEVATLRMPTMVARGRLPAGYKHRSPTYEDFVRALDTWEHMVEKFRTDFPAAGFLMFLLSDGKVLPGSSRKHIEECFAKKNVDPRNLRTIDYVNFLGAGTGFTGWRGGVSIEEAPLEVRQKAGLSFRLQDPDIKDKPEAKRKLFEETLERNPLRILIEGELDDGENMDLRIRGLVIKKTLEQLYAGAELARQMDLLAVEKKPNESDVDYDKRVRQAREARDSFYEQAEAPLILLTQLAVEQRANKLDFSRFSDADPRKRAAQAYFESIKAVSHQPNLKEFRDKAGELQRGTIIDYLTQKSFPFMPGQEDVPWTEFNFTRMGPKGFARNLRDFMGAKKASNELMSLSTNFGKLRKAEDYVGAVDKIWQAITEYNPDVAQEKAAILYEGIGRFNAGNWLKRFLPEPLGMLADFIGENVPGFKPSSFAKQTFGYAANSWRAVDLRNFLVHARMNGHITHKQESMLRKKLNCQFHDMLFEALTRMSLPGLFIVFLTFLKELGGQLEEQAKQQA